MATESLTIQILGDSSGLQQELGQVADLLGNLQQQMADVSNGGEQIGQSLQGISSAMGSLQGVSQMLGAISQQIQVINQQPISINVAPALGAIQQLIQAAQMAAQQLAALNMMSSMGGIGGMIEGGNGGPIRGFASGGLVTGPAGIDQVPARLSAGEFVLNHNAVAAVGLPALTRLNNGGGEALSVASMSHSAVSFPVRAGGTASFPPVQSAARQRVAPSPGGNFHSTTSHSIDTSTSKQTNNHFGGIEIHVRETADVSGLLHDLRTQGIGLRNRRG